MAPSATSKVHFDARNVGHFRVDLHLDRDPAPGPAGRPGGARCARRSRRRPAAAGDRGCRRPAPSRSTWASPGTPSPTPTASSSPKAGWPPGRARAPGSPSAPPAAAAGAARRPRRPARRATTCAPGAPTWPRFPRAAWLAAARRALTAAPYDAFGYADPRGLPELRQALAGYLARARGVRVTPDRIVVCSGFVQALALLGRALRAAGRRTLAVEALRPRCTASSPPAAGPAPSSRSRSTRAGAVVDGLGERRRACC